MPHRNHLGKETLRLEVMRENVSASGFRWRSPTWWADRTNWSLTVPLFALDARGRMTHLAPQFDEYLLPVDFIDGVPQRANAPILVPIEHQAYGALKLGLRDYLGKNGFPGAIIGLSGGIDSALVLAIAADALGPDRVRTVMMPSQFTRTFSWLDARAMATKLGVALRTRFRSSPRSTPS